MRQESAGPGNSDAPIGRDVGDGGPSVMPLDSDSPAADGDLTWPEPPLVWSPAGQAAPLGVAGALLAEAAAIAPGERVLLIGNGDAALPAALWRRWRPARLTIAEPNVAVCWQAGRELAAADAPDEQVGFAPDLFWALAPPASVDVVLLATPPERRLTRRWLLMARSALAPGGRLLLAGPNDAGIRPALADAAALFTVTLRDVRQRHRLAMATLSDPALLPPDWAAEPGIAAGTWEEAAVTVGGETITLRSLPGVFSHGRLDAGTGLLLDTLRVPPGGRVLDAGCGTGVLGLAAAKQGAGPVDLLDVNQLAVLAARENVARAGLTGARVLGSDVLAAVAGERYDLILSNPPFHTGKALDDRFARAFVPQVAAALAPGGAVQMVTNSFIRYDRALSDAVGPVTILAETGQYRVLRAVRR